MTHHLLTLSISTPSTPPPPLILNPTVPASFVTVETEQWLFPWTEYKKRWSYSLHLTIVQTHILNWHTHTHSSWQTQWCRSVIIPQEPEGRHDDHEQCVNLQPLTFVSSLPPWWSHVTAWPLTGHLSHREAGAGDEERGRGCLCMGLCTGKWFLHTILCHTHRNVWFCKKNYPLMLW